MKLGLGDSLGTGDPRPPKEEVALLRCIHSSSKKGQPLTGRPKPHIACT